MAADHARGFELGSPPLMRLTAIRMADDVLHVVCSDDAIILHGRSKTYHAKQLAQEAVFELPKGQTALCNQIVVC